MSSELMKVQPAELCRLDDSTMLKLVTEGDCSKLTPDQKLMYYKARCDAAGLDARAVPFQFIPLQGKVVLYATKACTDQLAAANRLSCSIIEQKTEDGVRIVTVRVKSADGREMEDVGCVPVAGLKGADLCNANMKAITKARRRATLSLCGLGIMDESELDTVNHAPVVEMPRVSLSEIKPATAENRGHGNEGLHAIQPVAAPAAPKPSNGGRLITEKQAKRLWAVARERFSDDNVRKDAVKSVLAHFGYQSTSEISMADYEAVIEAIQNPSQSSEPIPAEPEPLEDTASWFGDQSYQQ